MTEHDWNNLRKDVLFFKKVGNDAIHKAIENNRKKGIPNSFTRNGKLFWEMPDGSITHIDPNSSS